MDTAPTGFLGLEVSSFFSSARGFSAGLLENRSSSSLNRLDSGAGLPAGSPSTSNGGGPDGGDVLFVV